MAIFPFLTTIDPLLEAVKDMPEISVREDTENGYGFVMYQVAFEETFADPATADTPEERDRRLLLREARGLKYDLVTREIVSRPYHKFFNIGEKPETQPDKVDWNQPHDILEKLDGSMLTPLLKKSTNEILWMTKRGVTSVADTALQFLKDNPRYEEFCRRKIENGVTPIFEWCTRKQRIIIDYGPADHLVLTALRKNDTGEYYSYHDMMMIANGWGIDFVRTLHTRIFDINEFIEEARALKGEEGYIVRFHDGSMYKIKGEWYCQIHRTFDNLRFEKDVIRLILTDALDDAKPFMVETLRDNVESFARAIQKNLRDLADRLYWIVLTEKDRLNHSKKKFAEFVGKGELQQYSKFLFNAWDKDSTVDEILDNLINAMLSATSSQTNVDRSRYLIKGVRWLDFLGETVNE